MLKLNITSNFLCQAWVVFTNLAFLPLYIKHLGIEGYGLIGFYGLLQTCLSVFDIGVSATLSKEIAKTSGDHSKLKMTLDLIKTVEITVLLVSLIIAFGVAALSSFLTVNWLKISDLKSEEVQVAISIMGFIVAMRSIEGVYKGVLIGIESQLVLNMINIAVSTIRVVGALIVIINISGKIRGFFFWQAFVSLVALGLVRFVAYKNLPKHRLSGEFSKRALTDVAPFAGGMFLISILSLILMQVDKIVLSKILSLTQFAYYTLSASVAGAVFIFTSSIVQAYYPRMCIAFLNKYKDSTFSMVYHEGSQLVSVVAGVVGILVSTFSSEILFLWTHDKKLSEESASLLKTLAIGNLLNGLMWMPFQAQLASGWTSLTIKMNSIALTVFVPMILFATTRYGAQGTALVWIGLNVLYLVIGVRIMFTKILIGEEICWYLMDVILPLLVVGVTIFIFKIIGWNAIHPISVLIKIVSAGIVATILGLMSANHLRIRFIKIIHKTSVVRVAIQSVNKQ